MANRPCHGWSFSQLRASRVIPGEEKALMRIATLVLIVLVCCPRLSHAADWPQFRGPTGMGTTAEKGLPLEWDGKSGKNILWKRRCRRIRLRIPRRSFARDASSSRRQGTRRRKTITSSASTPKLASSSGTSQSTSAPGREVGTTATRRRPPTGTRLRFLRDGGDRSARLRRQAGLAARAGEVRV